MAARYGGEETAIVLTGKDSTAALVLAEKIRRAIQSESIAFAGKTISVTVSIGVATADSQRHFQSPDDLVGAADRAVYEAKESGRNCVRAFSPALQRGAA